MITACHTLIYSDDPGATRALFRDVLQLPYVVDTSTDPDWLIFRTGPSEMGVHPTGGTYEGSTFSAPRHHLTSFTVDDLDATMAELRERGAEFSSGPEEHGYGLVAILRVPGADDMQIYEPRHALAHSL